MPRKKKIETTTGTTKTAESSILKVKPIDYTPLGQVWQEAKASFSRRNRAASIVRTDRYKNIEDTELPFSQNGNYISSKDVISLCRKAYFGFGILKNIIDMMTEFSVSEIHLKGGSKDSQNFFKAWLKKINIHNLQDQFYREYYRSGNVFIHSVQLLLKDNGAKNLAKVLGQQINANILNKKLPIRYIFLNPEDMVCSGDISFDDMTYEKILTNYELERLRNPSTQKDKEFLNSLPSQIKERLKSRSTNAVTVPLPIEQTIITFYKKQDYEPFGVPMAFPILEAINFKKELLQIDMAVARTQQQMVLLVTTGAEPDKGGINQNNIKVLNGLFQNQSVGRTVVADYTTDVKFVIPDIGNILTEEKYKVIEKDINVGLNNILLGDEKFANQGVKVEVFLARLEDGREVFLNNVLMPEFKKIAESFNLKNYPTPYYKDISVKKEVEREKLFVRLGELGILTPDETISALENGVFPEKDQSRESQKEFSELRKKEMYVPVNNLGKPVLKPEGRPTGTKAPQSTKNVGRIGASDEEALFSASKIADIMKASASLESSLKSHLKEKFNRKKLTNKQIEVATEMSKAIMLNESEDKWLGAIATYCEKPVQSNSIQASEINAISEFFNVDPYMATILYHSRI